MYDEAIGELPRGGERLGQIGEQPPHLRRRLQVALGVAAQSPSRLRQRRLVADAGEDVVERAIGGFGEAHAVGREDRHVEGGGEIAQRVIVGFLVAEEMALELEIGAGAPEDADQAIDESADAERRAAQHGAAAERDEPGRVAVDLVERQRPFPLRRAQLRHGQETAQVAVAGLGFDEDGELEDRVRGRGARGEGGGIRNVDRSRRPRLGPRPSHAAIVSSAPTIALSPAFFAAR